VTIKFPESVPTTEFSEQFVQGMADRMAVSYCKYGAIAQAFPHRVRALRLNNEESNGSLEDRLQKYRNTGNTEWLLYVANFAMIEFLRPRHHEAHFRATDSKESPGRKWQGEIDPSTRSNRPEEWVK
jgi:hypothetical protein